MVVGEGEDRGGGEELVSLAEFGVGLMLVSAGALGSCW